MNASRRQSTQAKESTLTLTPKADITISPKQGDQGPHESSYVIQ